MRTGTNRGKDRNIDLLLVEIENGLLNLKTQNKSFTMLGKAKNWVSFTWTQALSKCKT